MKNHGIVTDIKRFAIHDGDGIRTTVFLKGCPLKCVWCHNPESISATFSLALFPEKCTSCGICAKVCPNGVHKFEDGVHTIDKTKCVHCGKCEQACPQNALRIYGKYMTVDEVISIVEEDKIFYETSGGGMTISGGEPAMQSEFTLALLKKAKEATISTAVDTCGFAKQEIYESFLPYTDIFLFDLKHMTSEGHLKCTGQDNALILSNLKFLAASNAKIEIRIPLVPGYNMDETTLQAMADFLADIKPTKIKLLAYHSYARSKYIALGLTDTMPDVERPNQTQLERAAEFFQKRGLNIVF